MYTITYSRKRRRMTPLGCCPRQATSTTQSEDLEAPPFSHPVLGHHFCLQGLPDSPGERVGLTHRRHHAPVRGGVCLPCEPSPRSKRHAQNTCPGTTFCSTRSLERKGHHPEGKSGHFSLQRVRHSTARRYLDLRARRNSDAPELIVRPEWNHGDEGATVEFTCTCHSAPPSHIVWVKTGQETPLQGSDRVKLKHKLTPPTTTEAWIKLQRLRKEDLGSYTCLAKNSVGQSTKTVEISGED
ncbi:UNVERIFIED_CONTAM: Kazald1 [Trichonephila clavipes]